MSTADDEQRRYEAEQRRLVHLLNEHPAQAIIEARGLPLAPTPWAMLRAAILADAGDATHDRGAVEEAMRLFRDRWEGHREPATAYNLANTLGALARMERFDGPDWYARTAMLRRDARALFVEAARRRAFEHARQVSQAYTNLGNALDAAFRWVEAYDAYQAALAVDPDHGVASGCAAQLVNRLADEDLFGHRPHLLAVAARLAYHAQQHADSVLASSGPHAVEQFSHLHAEPGPLPTRPRATTAYQRFVADRRLAMSPVMEGLGHHLRRWDDAHIRRVSEPIGTGGQVPPVIAMFNTMKADYLAARELLFYGTRERRQESGHYVDTLDYALYGRSVAMLTLAQRAAMDVLDKVAVAANEHFAIGVDPHRVYFHTLWHATAAPSSPWKAAVAAEIAVQNRGLLALTEMAVDLMQQPGELTTTGFLNRQRVARHAATHRFVVLHDTGIRDPRPSAAIEHRELDEYEADAVDTLRLARAALLYFLAAIEHRERRTPEDRISVPMMLMGHHWVRGQK